MDDVYLFEKNAFPCGPPFREGRLEEWWKVDEKLSPIFLILPVSGEGQERREDATRSRPTASVPGDGEATQRNARVPKVEHVLRVLLK